MSDCIIVGGGVIGLTLAWELAGQGATVEVFERSGFGSEASWAGAGILPPGCLEGAATAEARLRSLSYRLWPEISAALRESTGVDNGFRRCGGLELALDDADERRLAEEAACWRREGVTVESLSAAQLRELEPAVSTNVRAGYHLPETAQVRNPRHLKGLVAACAQKGVALHAGTPVTDFLEQGDRVIGVQSTCGRHRSDAVVVAGGAWSAMLLQRVGLALPIRPIRGQIVLLNQLPLPFRRVLHHGPRYLVPRPDGRMLVGSTEEDAGFDKRTTVSGIGGLMEFARKLVPSLETAAVERTWAGLRPGTPDRIPYLGPVPGKQNLYVAAGHFRGGLQMSPGTARLLRQCLLGQPPDIPLEPFRCERTPSDETSTTTG